MRFIPSLARCAGTLLLVGCAAGPADLILLHGTIHTVDPELGTVEALAVRGDRVLAAGTDASIEKLAGPGTRVVDLRGRTVVPGFIEGHGHFAGLGESRRILDLTQARSWQEVIDRVASAARETPPGEWILGRGWHQEKWDHPPPHAVEGFPTGEELSAATPRHPVGLTHASGHAAFFNARAMELAGVDASTPDPDGGEILRHPDGRPTGVFRENAQALVGRAHAAAGPEARRRDLEEALHIADRECLEKGVTSFQDAGSSFETIAVLRDLVERGELRTRLWVMVREDNERLAAGLDAVRSVATGDRQLTVRAIKTYMDGALGSRGAWLLAPYDDSPDSTGLPSTSLEELRETARLAAAHGFQLCVHAIGDRANREVLDVYGEVLAGHPGADLRWRIEHVQHLHPEDIPRFASLGVIASMQAIHCTSDAPFVVERLGVERAEQGAYAWRALLDSGARIVNGTDTPVEDVDPLACFRAAVTRRTSNGAQFFPEQCMTRAEALRSATLDAAWAAFEEDQKGSLSPGKFADLVVLSRDLLAVPEEELAETRVLATFVGGELLHEDPEFRASPVDGPEDVSLPE